jgi:hypothetical protein
MFRDLERDLLELFEDAQRPATTASPDPRRSVDSALESRLRTARPGRRPWRTVERRLLGALAREV